MQTERIHEHVFQSVVTLMIMIQSSVKIFLVPPAKQRVSEAASGGIRIKTCNSDTKEVTPVSTDVFNTLQEKNTKR